MDEQQMQELIAQVSQLLQQGIPEEQIISELTNAGLPQDQAQQIIDQAKGGQASAPGENPQPGQAPEGTAQAGTGTPDEDAAIVEQALSTLGPSTLMSLLKSWDAQPQEAKAQIMAQLEQLSSQESGQPIQAPPAAQGNAVEDAVFGRY